MKKLLLIVLLGVFSIFSALAQETIVKGSIVDGVTNEPLPEVTVTIEATQQETTTDGLGFFKFSTTPELGEQVLVITKEGFTTKRFPIVINEGETVDLTGISMDVDITGQQDLFTITLTDDELNDDDSGSDNISGLLSSSLDVFQRTAAFEFSSSFFRVRGLDSDNGTVMINGIKMNKFDTGRPQWANWGGLNDVVRNQDLSMGLHPASYTFGGILGSTNINTRASSYREGGQITYSSSNRSYTNRLMAKYSSGLMQDGWAYTIMAGRRWGDEGFQDATLYDANSFFAAIEKVINDKHSLNFTSIYAPNRRGRTSPNTQEVVDLKGIKYNEYWGYLNGEKKNSRIREVEEPILQLSHFWDINEKTSLNTTVAYQFGKTGSSRLDFPGGKNPSPAYYQNLPSYHLSQIDDDGPDFTSAYLSEQEFINDGQIDWNAIFQANANDNLGPYNTNSAAYVLYEDRVDDKTLSVNSVFTKEISDNILVNGGLNYRRLKSENFAEVIDLLGSNVGISNVDAFSQKDFNLFNPGQVANEGEKFRYNYNLYADEIGGFAQAQFKYNKVDFFVAGSVTKTEYQREGLYKNENQVFDVKDADGNVIGELDNSSGEGKKLDFNGFGAKAGFTYKITGKHLIDVNGAYVQQAPNLRNTYTNARESQDYVGVSRGQNFPGVQLTEEKIKSVDASYIFRSPIVKARLTGFFTKIEDANEVSFFFTQGEVSGFIQETLAGVDKRHVGAELGIEAQVTPTIKLKGAASVGQYTYDNNPFVYLTSTSEDFNTRAEENDGSVVNDIYKTAIKDYKIAGGPQRAYSVGFEYRDPDYWWFGATANFFSNTYVDISPLARSAYFTQDIRDGNTLSDYDPNVARELLRQEEIEDYMVVNLVGGKSWKIGDKYIGFFASIGNVLDKQYRTGGYEQGRNANYTDLLEDSSGNSRVFAPKYFFGRGANYFLNCYVRF